MNWLHLVSYFWGGVFLTNTIPHRFSGLRDQPFQIPFARFGRFHGGNAPTGA
ncbi:hypothetical protein [uncultured Bradyrhizobium sp.]|jgi:hypothetical protein|uniref:hypothetical protein n=1 Tax=uncultured Bradyrhizobium sp. TaxID=199684 RepID=UPI002616943E|nr:hypothetical protein [uncultured Bradyrhizobium sp.]